MRRTSRPHFSKEAYVAEIYGWMMLDAPTANQGGMAGEGLRAGPHASPARWHLPLAIEYWHPNGSCATLPMLGEGEQRSVFGAGCAGCPAPPRPPLLIAISNSITKQRPLALATAREGSCPPSPSTP